MPTRRAILAAFPALLLSAITLKFLRPKARGRVQVWRGWVKVYDSDDVVLIQPGISTGSP